MPSWQRHMSHCCTEDIAGGHGGLIADEVKQTEEVEERLSETHNSSLLLFCCSTTICTLF